MITKLGNKIHNKLANVFKLPSSFPWTAEVNNLCPLIYFLCDSAVSPESILKTTNPAGNFSIFHEHVSHLANFKQVNAGWKSFHSIFDPAVNYLFKVKTLEQGVKDVK